MFEEIELITLIVGMGIPVFMYANRQTLFRTPYMKVLVFSYCCFLAAWTATVIESYILLNVMNVIEHSLYFIGCLLLACWSFLFTRSIIK